MRPLFRPKPAPRVLTGIFRRSISISPIRWNPPRSEARPTASAGSSRMRISGRAILFTSIPEPIRFPSRFISLPPMRARKKVRSESPATREKSSWMETARSTTVSRSAAIISRWRISPLPKRSPAGLYHRRSCHASGRKKLR